MKDFIYDLYSNPNFPLYLGIVILVLLGAFFVVFLLGKKDKEKIEETKKLELEAINKEAFKEVTQPVDPIVKEEPVVEDLVVEETVEPDIPTVETPIVPVTPEESIQKAEEKPVIDTKVELPPNEEFEYKAATNNYEEITSSIDNDLKEMENKVVTPVINEVVEPPISMPTTQVVNEEVPKEKVVNEVFSSVYSPKKEPVMFDDTVEIELPRLK